MTRLYIEYAFIEKIIYKINEQSAVDFLLDKNEERDAITNLFLLIENHKLIFIDKDLEKETNPIIKHFIKKNGAKIRVSDFDIENEDLKHSFYFTTLSEKEIKDKYPYVKGEFISINNLKRITKFTNCEILPILKDETQIDVVSKVNLGFTYLKIVDAYILSAHDIKPVLNVLTKLNYSKCESIEMFTKKNKDSKGKTTPTDKSIDYFGSLFEKKINKQLTINFVSGSLHDRYLIADNFIVSSGYGFDVFNIDKSKKNTHFAIMPILYLDKIKRMFPVEMLKVELEKQILSLR
jgi:hypothetical protein